MKYRDTVMMSSVGARARRSAVWLALLLAFSVACVAPASDGGAANVNSTSANANSSDASGASSPDRAATTGAADEELTPEQVESGRRDQEWKRFVELDEDGQQASGGSAEKVDDITVEKVNKGSMSLPLAGDAEGPSVLRVQLLLDRARFSPGIIDGLWGKNTEKAVYWFQKREGLKATGKVDRATFERLFEVAGKPDALVIEHRLTEKDVSGPFVKIPEDIYERAKMECMCYESLKEKLAEMFHTSPDLLSRLNPQKNLDSLKAGDAIHVPSLRSGGEGSTGAEVAEIVISDGGHYLHARDANGRILHHFPSTLGSSYAPSPSGDFKVTAIARDPTWHYQPDLLTGVDDSKPSAVIPPGPNNAVGKVWMQLSKPHYGIHGTKAPETIGYATSHGCVRLTNWDAVTLSDSIKAGVPVRFVNTKSGS